MKTLICSKCKKEKSTNDFHRSSTRKTGCQSTCKECCKIYNKETYKNYYKNNKVFLVEKNNQFKLRCLEAVNTIKSSYGCLFCKENNPCCLDFHHVNKEDKIDGISRLLHSHDVKQLIEEINKCVVVCSNCHRKLHAKQINLPEKIEFCSMTKKYWYELVPKKPRKTLTEEQKQENRMKIEMSGTCKVCQNKCSRRAKYCTSCFLKRDRKNTQ